MSVNWHEIILNTKWLARLDKQAIKRFGQQGLADEAASYVLEKLAKNNWACCNTYIGKAKPETFLYTLTGNLLEEFSRKRFGRPRPPEWLKREGELWVSIWKMICLERQGVITVTDNLYKLGNREPNFIEGIIRTIKARLPWCGSSHREIPVSAVCAYEQKDDNHTHEIEGHSITQQLNAQQLEDTLQLMAQLLVFISRPSDKVKFTECALTMNNEQLDKLYQSLELSPEEQLLLKMAYQEGMKMNAIAKAMNLPPYQPGRLLKGILKRIEHALIEANISTQDIQSLLRESSE